MENIRYIFSGYVKFLKYKRGIWILFEIEFLIIYIFKVGIILRIGVFIKCVDGFSVVNGVKGYFIDGWSIIIFISEVLF